MSISKFTGRNIFGDLVENTYVVNITTASDRRGYTGSRGRLTWEGEEGPCLYVGDSQSSPIYEIDNPNDGVIEGFYTDYIVSGGFVDDFIYGLFDNAICN